MVLITRAMLAVFGRIRALTFGSFMPEVAMAAGEGRTRTYYIAADEVVWDYAPAAPTCRRHARSTTSSVHGWSPGRTSSDARPRRRSIVNTRTTRSPR